MQGRSAVWPKEKHPKQTTQKSHHLPGTSFAGSSSKYIGDKVSLVRRPFPIRFTGSSLSPGWLRPSRTGSLRSFFSPAYRLEQADDSRVVELLHEFYLLRNPFPLIFVLRACKKKRGVGVLKYRGRWGGGEKHGLLKACCRMCPMRKPRALALRHGQYPDFSNTVPYSDQFDTLLQKTAPFAIFLQANPFKGGNCLSRATRDLRAHLYLGLLVCLHGYPLPSQLVPRHPHLECDTPART